MDNREKILREIDRAIWYGGGYGAVQAGMTVLEKANAALAKLIDPKLDAGGGAPFKGIREAYTLLTGDNDIQVLGRFFPNNVSKDLRACHDFHSASFDYALGNALNTYASRLYRGFPFHEEVLISERRPARDFRTIHSVQFGYTGDLDVVDPEVGDYQSLAEYHDAESQAQIVTRGNLFHVTRKHIVNDNVGAVRRIVESYTRAARRTHAKYVWSFYLGNALCPDGTAWFTGGHGNLVGDALAITPVVTAIKALANMTEPDSLEKLGVDLASFDWNLIVPIDLWDTGVTVNQNTAYFTGNDLTTKVVNPILKFFGERNERVVVCPFGTDTNDWGVIRSTKDVPIIEMNYLSGKEDPEILVEPETGESNFKGDRIRYKVRHEYAGVLADYRGGYKGVVA
jgi:hypothetical protein